MSWEASAERHEAKGYTFRFAIGLDEAVFECDLCGSLVPLHGLDQHKNFHSILSMILNTTIL